MLNATSTTPVGTTALGNGCVRCQVAVAPKSTCWSGGVQVAAGFASVGTPLWSRACAEGGQRGRASPIGLRPSLSHRNCLGYHLTNLPSLRKWWTA
jgi:hypothetical protein